MVLKPVWHVTIRTGSCELVTDALFHFSSVFTAFCSPLCCSLQFISLPFFHPVSLSRFLCCAFAMRADINECERVPMPCAFQCVNSPGSYTCTCPPGRHLLGDGKSCAGLEHLPRFESLSYGFHSSQSSPERSSSQQRYHSMTSQSYHSYATRGGNYRLNARPLRSRRATKTLCPLGFVSNGDKCIGNCHRCLYYISFKKV